MSETANLKLQLIEASQSQKHLTVNEALLRVDASVARRVLTASLAAPPAVPAEGDSHLVALGASGDWEGHDNELAFFSNGGWDFVPPWQSLQVWSDEDAGWLLFSGAAWLRLGSWSSPGRALTRFDVMEFDHAIQSGTSSSTLEQIPGGAVVLGVTGRVTTEISGPTSWRLGVASSDDRYGSSLGTALGSVAMGLTSSPLTYYSAEPLVLTADGGDFSDGTVRLAVHFLSIEPPAQV